MIRAIRLVGFPGSPGFSSQVAFAEAAGIPAGTLARVEAGRNSPSALALLQVDRALSDAYVGIEVGDLVWMISLAVDAVDSQGWVLVPKWRTEDEGLLVDVEDIDALAADVVDHAASLIPLGPRPVRVPLAEWFL